MQKLEEFRLPAVLKYFSLSVIHLLHQIILSTLLGISVDPFLPLQLHVLFQLLPQFFAC